MSDLLVVAGFEDAHTAFLAGAALVRMQTDLALEKQDVAVVTREKNGAISVREAVEIVSGAEHHKAFWQTLVGLLLPASGPEASDGTAEASARLASIGIDETFTCRVAKTVRLGTSAVMVLASRDARDRVIGILRGFRAHIEKTPLLGEQRQQRLAQLSGQGDGDE
jgi:uncharacterized membrane protein